MAKLIFLWEIVFWFEFKWSLFETWQVSIGSGNDLAPHRWQAITWTNDDPVHWCIYAPISLDQLTDWSLSTITHILQIIYPYSFSWMKIPQFRIKFYWNVSSLKGPIDVRSTLVQIMAWWSKTKAITGNNVTKIHWYHFASSGHNEYIFCLIYYSQPFNWITRLGISLQLTSWIFCIVYYSKPFNQITTLGISL